MVFKLNNVDYFSHGAPLPRRGPRVGHYTRWILFDQLFLLIGVGGTGPLWYLVDTFETGPLLYLLGGFDARMWKVSFAALAERDLVNFPPRQVDFYATKVLMDHLMLNLKWINSIFFPTEANWEGTREGTHLPRWVVRCPLPQGTWSSMWSVQQMMEAFKRHLISDRCDRTLHGALWCLHLPCIQGLIVIIVFNILAIWTQVHFLARNTLWWSTTSMLVSALPSFWPTWSRHRALLTPLSTSLSSLNIPSIPMSLIW